MKRLSIIVPVYNVEKYLAKCLDSLLFQDIPYTDYEIIIINDGSTDGSLSIAESYKERYSNIKLITQLNKGLGAARNTGINAANGSCLFFVDSDDYIQANSLGVILTNFECNKLDVLRFNYETVNEVGEIIPKKKNATYNFFISSDIVSGETFLSEYLGWACYVCVFLFDTSFIKTTNSFFNEDIYFEDVEWLVQVMLHAKRVSSINKTLYFYLQRTGSITQSIQIENKHKVLNDKLFVVRFLKGVSLNIMNKKVRSWCKGLISLSYMGMLSYVANELPERKLEIIHNIAKENLWPFTSYRFTLKQKRDLFLINLSPGLYFFLRKKR